MDKFNEYVAETYLPEIVEQISSKYVQYKSSTTKKKEEILRRIHLVSFLCNTIKRSNETMIDKLMKRKIEEIEDAPDAKKKRTDSLEGVATTSFMALMEEDTEIQWPSYSPTSPTYSPHEIDDSSDDNSDYEIDDAIEEENLQEKGLSEEEGEMRFFCPIIMGSSPLSINLMLGEIGITVPRGYPVEEIDIIDMEDQKIYYIYGEGDGKYGEWRKAISRRLDIPKERVGVISVNWDSGFIILSNASGLNVKAADDFLAKRKMCINKCFPEIGLTDIEEEDITCQYVREKRAIWINEFYNEAFKEDPIKEDPSKTDMPDDFPTVTIEMIINKMEDVINTREGKMEANWNGKLMPFSVNDPIIIKEEITDTEMITKHFPTVIEIIGNRGYEEEMVEIFNTLKTIRKICNSDLMNNFQTICASKKRNSVEKDNVRLLNGGVTKEEMINALGCMGWQRKGRKRADNVEHAKQPEYAIIEQKTYPSWMEDLYLDEASDSGYNVLNTISFHEKEPTHPIDIATTNVCTKIMSIFSTMKCACTVAKYMNIGSRLGGSYLISISKENKMHSSIATIPIYFLTRSTDGEKEDRILCGFILRGPHHVRDSTDKINVLIVERVFCMEGTFYKKGVLFKDSNEKIWFASKNTFSKTEPIHNAFLHDLLFLPTNYIGDIIFQNASSAEELEEKSIAIVDENEDFLRHRIVELSLMGILGGSQEEGYFSGYRMLYMVLLELARGNEAGLIDIDGFIDGLNECVISNCLVLFMHCSLRRTLQYLLDVSNRGVSGMNAM